MTEPKSLVTQQGGTQLYFCDCQTSPLLNVCWVVAWAKIFVNADDDYEHFASSVLEGVWKVFLWWLSSESKHNANEPSKIKNNFSNIQQNKVRYKYL